MNTPASCSARLLNRRPGAEAVERAVGLTAARAFLADLQAHARRCEEYVRSSGAGAVLYPIAAAIANFVDCKLSRLDPSALRPGGDETHENTALDGPGNRLPAPQRRLRRFGVGEDGAGAYRP